eukprot:605229-Alexandrium_andersonii.AAC.1
MTPPSEAPVAAGARASAGRTPPRMRSSADSCCSSKAASAVGGIAGPAARGKCATLFEWAHMRARVTSA